MLNKISIKTPKEIVEDLNKHIIGQKNAKRAVAIALRNRHRRRFVSSPLQNEITPKNILMIGSTGVGKTEIARRLAKLDNAPFIKVEATKFTEIGYVGRDVESIIRDLVDISIKLVREEIIVKTKDLIQSLVEERLLNILLTEKTKYNYFSDKLEENRKTLKLKLSSGILDDDEVEINTNQAKPSFDFVSLPGMENMNNQFNNILESISPIKKKKRKVKIKDAIDILTEEEISKFIDKDEIKREGIKRVEENGIVFLDEIDKITQSFNKKTSIDISREGVQRDLLPLLDGGVVITKYGIVKTNHILFIAAGAFHVSKPSDLLPELQGRLPVRVKLNSLTIDDFINILLEPDYSLIKQYKDLLKTEGVNLIFSKNSIHSIAEITYKLNQNIENIGARRLYTVMEKLLDEILFTAGDTKTGDFFINSDYVYKQLKDFDYILDLKRFIL